MGQLKVGIIGAGVGGLCLAQGLKLSGSPWRFSSATLRP